MKLSAYFLNTKHGCILDVISNDVFEDQQLSSSSVSLPSLYVLYVRWGICPG